MSTSVAPVTGLSLQAPMSVLDRVRPATEFTVPDANSATATQKAGGEAGQPPEVARKFEVMVISFMLKDVMKNDMQNAFGKGFASDHYVSVFADTVAQDIVDAGGIGISKQITTARVDHE